MLYCRKSISFPNISEMLRICWRRGSCVKPLPVFTLSIMKPNQTRPNQTRPDQTKPDQTRPDQTGLDQSRPEQSKARNSLPVQIHPWGCQSFPSHAVSSCGTSPGSDWYNWDEGAAHGGFAGGQGLLCAACRQNSGGSEGSTASAWAQCQLLRTDGFLSPKS